MTVVADQHQVTPTDTISTKEDTDLHLQRAARDAVDQNTTKVNMIIRRQK